MTKPPAQANPKKSVDLVYPAYGLTVALLVIAYLFPILRVWGLNFAAFLPWWVAAAGLTLFVVLVPIAKKLGGGHDQGEDRKNNVWPAAVIAVTIIGGISYWVFHTQTHFLGDGYQILSFLASDQPFLKPFEYGTAWLHLALYKAIGSGESAALASHRIVSIASGILYVIGVAYLSQMLFDSLSKRMLFLLGMITAGLSILFFGYVENYSLLILSSLAFVIVGLKIAAQKLNRIWIVAPVAAGLFFHVLAITMIPAAVYLLSSGTAIDRWFSRQRRSTRRLAIAGFVVVAAIAGVSLYVNNLVLKLAVLPLIPHDLTVPGYSLFSPAHVIDFVNLLFLLMPGILVLIAFARKSRIHFESRAMRFLMWITVTMLAAAFVFDPKLGMPRDWDLFAFASVPTLVMLYSSVLGNRSKQAHTVVVLSIGLSIVLLSTRVAILAAPGPSLGYAEYIRDLDPVKTRNLWFVMIQYHRDQGEAATALEMQEEWSRRFPELGLNRRAYDAYHQGRYLETIKLCQSIIERNPIYADAWLNAGVAYRALRRTDSALYYLEVANALSPYTPSVYINLAVVLIDRGLLNRAKGLLDEAITTDSTFSALYYQYARIHRMQGDQPRYLKYLAHAASKADADPTCLRELASAHLQQGDTRAARAAFRGAISKGLDSSAVDSMIREHPQLSR